MANILNEIFMSLSVALHTAQSRAFGILRPAHDFVRGFQGQIELNFNGSAGQSFGVWNTGGVFLKVVGDCNDYVGKGMNGGRIVAVAPGPSTFQSEDQSRKLFLLDVF